MRTLLGLSGVLPLDYGALPDENMGRKAVVTCFTGNLT